MKRPTGKYLKQKYGKSPWLKPEDSPHGGVSPISSPYGYCIYNLGIHALHSDTAGCWCSSTDSSYASPVNTERVAIQPHRPNGELSSKGRNFSFLPKRPTKQAAASGTDFTTQRRYRHSKTLVKTSEAAKSRAVRQLVFGEGYCRSGTRSALTQTNQTTHR
jgi:hypothetical protein